MCYFTQNIHTLCLSVGGRMDGRTDARTHGRTDGRTDGWTENIYSIFRDKLLLRGEHVYFKERNRKRIRNIRARSKAKSKASTNNSPSIQITPASNLNDFADIDTNYFKEKLHNSQGDLAKTQKLLEEMKQYFEGLNMPHGHLNIGKSVRKNSSQINEAINHLLRVVFTYQAGKDMNIPNSNIHIDSHENSRQFIEETCRFEREMFNIHFSHCSTCHRRKINLHVNSNGVCSRCSKEKKGHNKFGHENSALPLWIDTDGNKHFELPKVLLDLQLAECLLIQYHLLFLSST
jgi:hypothetical protein